MFLGLDSFGRYIYIVTMDGLKVPICHSDSQVIFEAEVGVGRMRDIAIDDLTMFDGSCPPTGL